MIIDWRCCPKCGGQVTRIAGLATCQACGHRIGSQRPVDFQRLGADGRVLATTPLEEPSYDPEYGRRTGAELEFE